MKLLVSVVNYCDPEFYSTIKSLWETAQNKDELYFSLVSEDTQLYDFSFIPESQIVYRHYDTSIYRGGLCWARNLATQVEFEYDFFIQFDSHTYGSEGWDVKGLEIYKELGKEKNKFIIAYGPANYEILENGDIDFNFEPVVSMSAQYYTEMIPGFKFPGYKVLQEKELVRSFWATCCYLLAPKSWVDEVGISAEESFNTEEICLSIRTYAKDWEIYSYGSRDTFHHISHKQPNGVVTRQDLRPWADDRKEDYWAHVEKSTGRLSLLMSGQLDVKKEKVEEFFEHTGISKKYLEFIPDYSSHVIVEPRSHGMPPRRDK
jgi:hypothetical protein